MVERQIFRSRLVFHRKSPYRTMWRGWLSVLTIVQLFYGILSVITENCCSNSEDYEAIDSINTKATFLTIDLYDNSTKWDLQVNISWTPVEDYDRYIVELETYSDPTGDVPFCNPSITCTFDGVSVNNWKVFNGIQFGSTQTVTTYITRVEETQYRGPYFKVYPKSPDCYDETKSIEFCETQAVQYAGKPIEIKVLNMTLSDDEKEVTVTIRWRQPAHVNPDTPISYFLLEWYGEELTPNNLKIMDVEFEPSAYVTTELNKPLLVNTSYTLEITTVVMASMGNKRGLSREIVFITTSPVTVQPSDNGSNTVTIVLIAVGSVILLAIVVLVFIWKMYSSRFERLDKDDDILDLDVIIPNHEKRRPTLIAYPAYEIARSDVSWTERKELGRGYYGEVYKCSALINGVPTEAAVKVPKQFATSTEIEDFIHEISLVIKLGDHPNLVRFLGCCTTSTPLMMINEFVRYGDMFSFMQKIKNKKAPKERIYDIQNIDQLNIAKQIARGMEYIASQRCVHGDLAARNVLVDEDLVVKITDFGLSRDVYASNYIRLGKDAKLPWKWYSLESMTGERKLTIKGDVWSFGVVLFEIFTFCDPPYALIPSLSALVEMLESGKRMSQPEHCPDAVYSIMMKCWDANPRKRPTFTKLIAEFDKLIGAESASDYLPIFDDTIQPNETVIDLKSSVNTLSGDADHEMVHSDSYDSRDDNPISYETQQAEIPTHENVVFKGLLSKSKTDGISNDIILDDGKVERQGNDGHMVPMDDIENKNEENAQQSRERKISSLKDTKYDVFIRFDEQKNYIREDSEGYVAPIDKEVTEGKVANKNEIRSSQEEPQTDERMYENVKAKNKNPRRDVQVKKEDITFGYGTVLHQDDEGYTLPEEDDDDITKISGPEKKKSQTQERLKGLGPKYDVFILDKVKKRDDNDVIFENDDFFRQDSQGYTLPEGEDDDAQKTESIRSTQRLSALHNQIQDGNQGNSDSSKKRISKKDDPHDIYFGDEKVYQQDSEGYTVIDDDDKSSHDVSKSREPSDIYFEKEEVYRQDSMGYTIPEGDDDLTSFKGVNEKHELKIHEPNDTYLEKQDIYKQDNKGYITTEDDVSKNRVPNEIYFQREDVFRQDSNGYALPDDDDDDDGIQVDSRSSTVMQEDNLEYENVTFNNVIRKPDRMRDNRQLHLKNKSYGNTISPDGAVRKDDGVEKEVGKQEKAADEENVYVNGRLNGNRWKTPAFNYF
ncbi:uncharacterized protein LOC117110746 [Anneissia japonica]|uniref:uncharacterized protein LOC117110746 n=1 Tax=Anneissia japonica TaxID=1529436 RepID=UPI001425641D|nr:uncharacterized protein LOC117110746 [Anneissia japonica]